MSSKLPGKKRNRRFFGAGFLGKRGWKVGLYYYLLYFCGSYTEILLMYRSFSFIEESAYSVILSEINLLIMLGLHMAVYIQAV